MFAKRHNVPKISLIDSKSQILNKLKIKKLGSNKTNHLYTSSMSDLEEISKNLE